MPKKEIINVDMKGGNPNLSPGARFGDLVFVAGQTGTHPDTGKLGEGVAEQTRFTIERIKRVLEAAGTNLENVLSVSPSIPLGRGGGLGPRADQRLIH